MANQDMDKRAEQEQLARALHELTPAQLAELSPKFERLHYANGELIIEQEETGDNFYVVIAGVAEVCHIALDGHISVVDRRLPGEYFGEIALLRDKPRTARVRAPLDGEVEVLALNSQEFADLIEESRGTEAHMALDMIQRLIRLADAQ